MTITDTQSYSLVIRDAFFAATVQLPFFQGFIARRSKQLPVATYQLPFLGVFIVSEDMTPDGDSNAGEIRFIHKLQIGWQVMIENNDPVASEQILDQAFWAIMNGLWRDPKLMNFLASDMPDNTRVESIERGTRRHVWGSAGLNNETPYGELEYVATAKYRASYGAIPTDDLLDINIQTVPLADDGTVPDASEVQRIISDYEFQPGKGANNVDPTRGPPAARQGPPGTAAEPHAKAANDPRRAGK
jgi:hypothetical protein